MVVDLTTTNLLLGIMAVVSLLEAIALIVAGVMGARMYRQVSEQIQAMEQRHLAPLTNHTLPLIDDAKKLAEDAHKLAAQASPVIDEARVVMKSVQRMTERVEHSLSRLDETVQGTLDTAEHAVDRVQGGVRKTAGTVVGVVRGVRTAIETFLTDQPNGARGHHTARTPDMSDMPDMPRPASAPGPKAPPRSHVVYPDGPPYPSTGAPSTGRTS